MEAFKVHIPLLHVLCNPGMRDRHWAQVSKIVGFKVMPTEDTSFAALLDLQLESFVPQFEAISEAASKEYALERALLKMKSEWEPVSPHSST